MLTYFSAAYANCRGGLAGFDELTRHALSHPCAYTRWYFLMLLHFFIWSRRHVAAPSGSVQDDIVTAAADEYGMTLIHTSMRLFHH